MTPSEFKAWFDGFTEAIADNGPTTAQWARIKARVAEIDGKPVTERIYVDRYWPSYRPYYERYYGNAWPSYYATSTGGAALGGASGAVGMAGQLSGGALGAVGGTQAAFNGLSAMADLGRAEAQTLKAGA